MISLEVRMFLYLASALHARALSIFVVLSLTACKIRICAFFIEFIEIHLQASTTTILDRCRRLEDGDDKMLRVYESGYLGSIFSFVGRCVTRDKKKCQYTIKSKKERSRKPLIKL